MAEKTITVFGTAKAKPGDRLYSIAEQLGTLLARTGFAIANGGYGGTMEACAKGAVRAASQVIGVTCSAFKRGKANQYVTREINTDSLNERLKTLLELGDGYIVLQGGTGTLLELAAVWEHKNKGFTQSQKPIILLGEFWKPLIDTIEIDDPQSVSCLQIVTEPAKAAEILENSLLR